MNRRIRHMEGNTFRFQGGLYPVDQAGAQGTAAAVMDEDFCSAETPDQAAGLAFGIPAENKAGGGVEGEIIHEDHPFLIYEHCQ